MKAKEVPQDDANMMRGKWKDPIYTVDENGKYTTSYSMGWEVKNAVMKQAWENLREKLEEVRKKVLAGELSPVAFFMERNMMDVGLLAQYMEMRKWSVKKHLKPRHYKKLPQETLEKYADIFNITVEEMNDMERIKNEELPE